MLSSNKAWYVANKNQINNTLVAVQGNNHPLLMSNKLETRNLVLVNPIKSKKFLGNAKVRYRQEEKNGQIEKQ